MIKKTENKEKIRNENKERGRKKEKEQNKKSVDTKISRCSLN